VAPYHPNFFDWELGIRDVLEQHANAFVEWRYYHERRGSGVSFEFSTFVPTLELVLDEFATLYRSEPASDLFKGPLRP
jgi:hypothetical protein